MNHENFENLSKLEEEDSCFIFYVKHKTDDLSILELAKIDNKNSWILSNDKFRDWLEKKPGEYDRIIANRVISDFWFGNYGESLSRYKFHCPQIKERILKIK